MSADIFVSRDAKEKNIFEGRERFTCERAASFRRLVSSFAKSFRCWENCGCVASIPRFERAHIIFNAEKSREKRGERKAMQSVPLSPARGWRNCCAFRVSRAFHFGARTYNFQRRKEPREKGQKRGDAVCPPFSGSRMTKLLGQLSRIVINCRQLLFRRLLFKKVQITSWVHQCG